MKKAVIVFVLMILLVASMAFALPRQETSAPAGTTGASTRAVPDLVELNMVDE